MRKPSEKAKRFWHTVSEIVAFIGGLLGIIQYIQNLLGK